MDLELHPESHGNGDLVAHFFRRAFNLIHWAALLIATNTIAQGDTRYSALRWIIASQSSIYEARKRLNSQVKPLSLLVFFM